MARKPTGYYNPIEYIGPRPQKAKKPNYFGGWLIVVLAVSAAFYFGKPLIADAWASDKGPSTEQSAILIADLESSNVLADKLAAEALRYTSRDVLYDPAYFQIEYPNGDVPSGKGVAADLVIRCFREIGTDLQKEVHEDMSENFRRYPNLWAASEPDSNIDHRRVQNLQRFFSRNATSLSLSGNAEDYRTGDVIVWSLSHAAQMQIGIIVPAPAGEESSPWVVYHEPNGEVIWEKAHLVDVLGHFRYPVK